MISSKRKLYQSIVFVLLAAALQAVATALTRSLSGELHWSLVVLSRSVFGLLFVFALMVTKKQRLTLSKNKMVYARALVGGFTMCLTYYAAYHLPPSDAIILYKTAPIWLVFAAFVLIGQSIQAKTLVAMLVSFAGIYLVTAPYFDVGNMATMVGLGAGVGIGLVMYIMTRLRDVGVNEVVSHFMVFSLLVSIGLVTFFEAWSGLLSVNMFSAVGLSLTGIGIAVALVQIFMTRAYQTGDAKVVATVGYSSILFAILFEVLFLSHVPSMDSLIGIGLVTIGVITVTHFSKQRRKSVVLSEICIEKTPFDHYQEELEDMESIIAEAEAHNSCEIQIHIELEEVDDHIQRAQQAFDYLGTGNAPYGNGILVYINIFQHEIVLLADGRLENRFGKRDMRKLSQRMIKLIEDEGHMSIPIFLPQLGKLLGKFYPANERFANALPNTVSVGEM